MGGKGGMGHQITHTSYYQTTSPIYHSPIYHSPIPIQPQHHVPITYPLHHPLTPSPISKTYLLVLRQYYNVISHTVGSCVRSLLTGFARIAIKELSASIVTTLKMNWRVLQGGLLESAREMVQALHPQS